MTNQNQVQQAQQTVAPQKEKQNAFVTKVAEKIAKMQEQGQINLPDNYSAANALQAAYFTLTEVDFGKQQSLIEKVTPESVAFALQDMAIQGLSVAKKQGYFVPYGDKLQFIRSYHGTQAVLKRLSGVKDVWANVIWKGEDFEVDYNERGQLSFRGHKANWKSATGKKEDIEGAYCIIEREDGTQYLTVMTMEEITTAWSTSKNKSVQEKYPQEMAKRTVINRASKAFLNTSDDSDLLVESFNREYEYGNDRKDMGVIEEIKKNANQTPLSIQSTPIQPPEQVNLQTGEITDAPQPERVRVTPHVEQPDMYQKAQEETLFTQPTQFGDNEEF